MERENRCRSCRAAVIWARLEPKMSWAPIDVEPVPNGNIGLRKVAGEIIGHYIKKDEQYDHPRRTNHFATCPYAKQHKKGGR